MQPGDQRVQQLSITPWCQQHVPSRGSAYHYSSILTNSKLVCQVVTQLGLLLLLPSNVPSLLPGGSLGNWQGCSIFAKSVASVLSVFYRCLGTLLTVSKSSTNSNTVKAISNKLKIFLEDCAINKVIVQSDWIKGDTHIYSLNNEKARPIKTTFIDFTEYGSEKLLRRIPTIVNFN